MDKEHPKDTLAIITNYPIENYLKKGYDFMFSLYNPLGFFETVHLFEPNPFWLKHNKLFNKVVEKIVQRTIVSRADAMGKQYDLYVHRTLDYQGVRQIFAISNISCLRIYEMCTFDIAKRLSDEFQIPLVVSIH